MRFFRPGHHILVEKSTLHPRNIKILHRRRAHPESQPLASIQPPVRDLRKNAVITAARSQSCTALVFTVGSEHVSNDPPITIPFHFPSLLKFAEEYDDDSLIDIYGVEFSAINAGSGGSRSDNWAGDIHFNLSCR